MEHTEVAVLEYLPGSWPPDAGISCLVRRTRIPVDQIPQDQRARKLRTIDKAQLELALAGQIDHVYGYSFILTNRDVSTAGRLIAVEHWYRYRNADVVVMPTSGRDPLDQWVNDRTRSA